jgi:Holliday junction resolvase RusA-like endonuclease
VLKAVTDAMNGIVYGDDAQIVTVTVTKAYADTPRAEVWVSQIVSLAEQQAA